jgi:error-prone DNA polymerase
VAANFTPAEADELRRSMATFKAKGKVSYFHDKLINGMIAKGYTPEYAQRVFRQLEGFGSYGFPESHAVSFALLVYVSSWLKCYHPDVFACALLNSLPMGFYQPAQIVIDAQKHGVVVRPVDVNHSVWDNQLEEKSANYCAIRLGFRHVKGLRQEDADLLLRQRGTGFLSVHHVREVGLPDTALQKLADADAFRSLQKDRREALWQAVVKDHVPGALFGRHYEADEQDLKLPALQMSEHVVYDYASTSLSLKAHPISFVRNELTQLHTITTASLKDLKDGDWVKVAGLVLVRQRPGTASGICFITLEDETGIANLVVFKKLFDQYRKQIIQSRLLMVEGKVQIEGEVIHVIAQRCHDVTGLLRLLTPSATEALQVKLSRADERTAVNDTRTAGVDPIFHQTKIWSEGRNFR